MMTLFRCGNIFCKKCVSKKAKIFAHQSTTSNSSSNSQSKKSKKKKSKIKSSGGGGESEGMEKVCDDCYEEAPKEVLIENEIEIFLSVNNLSYHNFTISSSSLHHRLSFSQDGLQ